MPVHSVVTKTVQVMDSLLLNVTSVCNRRVLFVILITERLDTATKQRAAKEAECTDQRQHVFVKLLEQSKFMSASEKY